MPTGIPDVTTFREAEMSHESLQLLQTTIDREIPMCAKMGMQVVSFEDGRLSMSAPLDLNRNHQLTGFAGSLNALCTVTGWGMVVLVTEQYCLPGDIVMRRSAIKYLRPVESEEIVATCTGVGETERAHFVEMLQEKGQAKLDLRTESYGCGQPAGSFHGSYVVLGSS